MDQITDQPGDQTGALPTVVISPLNWAEAMDEEELKKKKKNARKFQKRKKKAKMQNQERIASEQGREIFLGGIHDSDIFQRSSVDCKSKFSYRNLRRQKIIDLVGKFGDIESMRTHWDKGYLFVVFKEQDSATQMFNQLQHYEGRKQYVKLLKNELQEIQKPTFVSPKADFYVRWPQSISKRKRSEVSTTPNITTTQLSDIPETPSTLLSTLQS